MPPSSSHGGGPGGAGALTRPSAACCTAFCCCWACSVPGFAGFLYHSQTPSLPFCAQSSSIASLAASPVPTLAGDGQSSGRKPGTVEPRTGGSAGSAVMLLPVPSGPVLPYQQLPVLVGTSPPKKPTPLGATWPVGERPMMLS